MLLGKVRGCLYGGAIGDAMGAPAEWKMPPEIRERYGEIVDFVEPWDGPSEIGKGDGRFTDDTHMTRVLGEIYVERRRRTSTRFVFAERIVPLIADEPRWLAERGQEMPLVDRLFYPEKWLLMRLRLANADPRLGGVGNMVNCGAAMYASPVGIVNACDPVNAYREAIEIFSAHQWSYGLEAAAVMAACVAEAFRPARDGRFGRRGRRSIWRRKGPRQAIAAVVDEARGIDDWRDAIGPLRDAIRPFDGSAEDGVRDRGNKTDDWAPSRLQVDRGGAGRARLPGRGQAATSSRRSSAPPTTAATTTRSPAWPGPSPARCTATASSARSGSPRSTRRTGSISIPWRAT